MAKRLFDLCFAGCLALLYGCWLSMPSRARAQQPFDVGRALTGQQLGRHVAIVEDAAGTLTIEDVTRPGAARQFRPSSSLSPSLGFTTAAHWVRIAVQNTAAEPRRWLLELSNPNLDTIELYEARGSAPGASFAVRRAGDQLPFAAREVAHRTFVFQLAEPAHSERSYYLRVQTEGALNLPFVAWSEESLRDHLNVEQPLMWMFYGLILVMALYNLFIFVSVRQLEYLYYCLYVLSFLAFEAAIKGHTFQYLWPSSPWLANHSVPFFLGITLFWALRFIIRFLSLKQVLPWAYQSVFWGGNISACLAVYGLFGSYALSVRGQVLIGVPLNLVMVVVTTILVRRNFRPAKFYALAWSLFIVGVLLTYLSAAGLIASTLITEWAVQLGAAVEVVLLSLALADRINLMRKDLAELNQQLSDKVIDLRNALRLAEAATQAKGEFLATVSHELRTPLNTIINIPQGLLQQLPLLQIATCSGCNAQFQMSDGEQVTPDTSCPDCARRGVLQLSQRREFEGRPDQLAEHLGHIERSGKHLLEIVNGILDFSKLGAGRIELKPLTVDLHELMGEVVEPLRPLAMQSGVLLELLPLPAHAELRADPLRLRQVLINLIGNAIKFSDGRGTVHVSVQREQSSYLFKVADQGIGIAPEDHQKIFRSFEQIDQGDTRRFGGTGLGLAITKSLVELHDGKIWLESTPGQGATFFVRLPSGGPGEASSSELGNDRVSAQPHLAASPHA